MIKQHYSYLRGVDMRQALARFHQFVHGGAYLLLLSVYGAASASRGAEPSSAIEVQGSF
jgi:hypothetical protein